MNPEESFNLADYIIRFEEGSLSQVETIKLFQHLVDTGMAWTLQGFYGRYAESFIEQGLVTPPMSEEAPEKPPAPSVRRGRPSTKQKGALVAMAQRRNKGNGIIISRVENLRTLTEKEIRQELVRMKRYPIEPAVHGDWNLDGFVEYNNYVLVHWFDKPSDYTMDKSYYNRTWYPDKWVKVVGKAPKSKG